MIPETLMIAREAEHISDTHGIGTEDITLDGEPVSVTTDHLEVGFDAFLNQNGGGRPTGHSYDSRLVIGDVDRIDHAF
jgi:hypothetical protein